MPLITTFFATALASLGLFPYSGVTQEAQAQRGAACTPVPAGFRAEMRARRGRMCADVLTRRDADGTRRLRVFDGRMLGFQLDSAINCLECGGSKGDALENLTWERGSLVVWLWGGSGSGYWNAQWRFAHRDGRWVLAGWDRVSSGAWRHDVIKESMNTLTGRAILTYLPPEGGCDKAEEESEGSFRCPYRHTTERQCRVALRAPSPRYARFIDERQYACDFLSRSDGL